MPIVINATPGDPAANSYETLVEAQAYMSTRLYTDAWDNSDQQDVALIMAARVLDALAQPFKTLIPPQNGAAAYYRVRRMWNGLAATATQRLAWPRTGMFDANNNTIDPSVIPQELKDAQSELAIQLLQGDRTADNSVITQGITSLKAGSVALGFKDNIVPQVIPDAVFNLMPQSWLTDELYILANQAQFDVVSEASPVLGVTPPGTNFFW